MMKAWRYQDYKNSVFESIQQAVGELGFRIDQAIGYATSDLDYQLAEFPEENVFAMVALGKAIIDKSAISFFPKNSEFCNEIKNSIFDKKNYPTIQADELGDFEYDAKHVINILLS